MEILKTKVISRLQDSKIYNIQNNGTHYVTCRLHAAFKYILYGPEWDTKLIYVYKYKEIDIL